MVSITTTKYKLCSHYLSWSLMMPLLMYFLIVTGSIVLASFMSLNSIYFSVELPKTLSQERLPQARAGIMSFENFLMTSLMSELNI